MSRHWKPPSDPVESGVVPIVLSAVLIGLVAGGALSWTARNAERGPTGAAIEWNAVQTVPTRAPDAFGTCKWGGGTNCVVDGDTFYVNGAKVRIAGIDAPETHDYRCGSELALGNQATEKLRTLLNSGAVTMTSIEHFGQSGTLTEGKSRDRDRYGRLLRNVAVDGADVGAAMVGAGVAREYGSGRRPWC